MIIKTRSYNDGTSSYNDAATESWWVRFNIQHRMNSPAECWVTLADPDGSLMQKYNVDANDVYVGPGRIKVKNDADDTTYYDGRILKATHHRENGGSLVLYCQDWMSQLDEEHITYDFREDLDGNGNYYDLVWPDMDGTAATTCRPAWVSGANCWVMCDYNDYHSADEWNTAPATGNGHYLVFLAGMSGTVTSTVGPYSETVTAASGGTDRDTFDTDIEGLWNDDTNAHLMEDNDEDWDVVYSFYNWINASGTDYHSSTDSMTIKCRLYFTDVGSECTVSIYDSNTASYVKIGFLEGEDTSKRVWHEWSVPEDIMDDCVDSNGIVKVKFDVEYNAVATALNIEYLVVETEAITTQEDSAYEITDTATGPDMLLIGTDLALTGTGCWTGQPFAIVKKIYKHLDTAEGGTLISNYDPLVELTAAGSIEHTDGITVRRYEERTPLQILDDVRGMDKAVFFMELGTTTLTWKSTFNDGAPTALGDSDVITWSRGMYDYTPMRNEYHLYGPRQNDAQIVLDTADFTTDPGSDSKSTFGVTRSGVIKNTGTNTEYEIYSLGNALVERDEDVHLYISARIAGLSTTYKLGGEVSVTSSALDLSAVKYIITDWSYDSDSHETTISMLPRSASTKGLMELGDQFVDAVRRTRKEQRLLKTDTAVLEVIE